MSSLPPSQPASRWSLIAALAAVYIIWGSTYLGIRVALETLPPFILAGTRFIVAGSIVLIWQWQRGAALPSWRHWRSAAVIGGLMILGGNGGVTWAEQHVPSGLAALLVGAVPIWIVMLDWLAFGGKRPNGQMALGLAGGLAGLALLIGPAEFAGDERVDMAGAGALMLASISWAVGSLYARRASLPALPMVATGIEMLAGGTLQLLAATILGEWSELDLGGVSLRSGVAMIYLALFGSLIGFSAYVWLLRHTTAARAASYAYVNPVVAVVLGWALLDEDLSPRTVLAATIIIGSVVIITSFRAQHPEQPRPAQVSKAATSEASASK